MGHQSTDSEQHRKLPYDIPQLRELLNAVPDEPGVFRRQDELARRGDRAAQAALALLAADYFLFLHKHRCAFEAMPDHIEQHFSDSYVALENYLREEPSAEGATEVRALEMFLGGNIVRKGITTCLGAYIGHWKNSVEAFCMRENLGAIQQDLVLAPAGTAAALEAIFRDAYRQWASRNPQSAASEQRAPVINELVEILGERQQVAYAPSTEQERAAASFLETMGLLRRDPTESQTERYVGTLADTRLVEGYRRDDTLVGGTIGNVGLTYRPDVFGQLYRSVVGKDIGSFIEQLQQEQQQRTAPPSPAGILSQFVREVGMVVRAIRGKSTQP